jgi:hypothetical protein
MKSENFKGEIIMNGTCTACGQPCQVSIIDFGIGSYEYWGALGIDIQLEAVSDCCEEPAVDHNNNIITVQMIQFEQAVARAGY